MARARVTARTSLSRLRSFPRRWTLRELVIVERGFVRLVAFMPRGHVRIHRWDFLAAMEQRRAERNATRSDAI